MKKYCFAFSAFLLIFVISVTSAQESLITEETWSIKTYPYSDPDPVPILTRRPAIYPYFSFNKFSHTGRPQDWKVVVLENDYIKVFALPEVGGKVYGAIEKSTGKEFIYHNKVLKFRQIAMRGPWTSGGIEYNFGIVGHTPNVASPVDYLTRKNPDGSVSYFIGTMDLTSRTRWTVEVNLPPDKAYFRTRTTWYNPTPFNKSYYSWSNNAVKASEDLQYFYPGNFVIPHGYNLPMNPWPVDKKGRDLSWYKNNNFGHDKSHFVMGKYENFFGGYWHNDNFGFGHWALYDDMPGKKMWIWALSRQGAIWEKLLTDTDGQYSEPQSGRYFSQSDHALFTPYTCDRWSEILFPYKDTDGIADATPYGVMNILKKSSGIEIRICALQKINDDLIVRQSGRELFREHIILKPMEVFRKKIELNSSEGFFEVCIKDKLYYTGNPEDKKLKRPINYNRVSENTAEGLYLAGEFHEKRRGYDTAMKKYIACLEREPDHIRAKTRIAELYCRRAEYDKALKYAAEALENSIYDPDANYIYGVISRQTGSLTDAKETLGWAARSMKYRSNAYCQMAEIFIYEKKFDMALQYAQKALDFNKYNIKVYEVLSVIYRKTGNKGKAEEILTGLLEIDPLNHTARFEKYLLNPTEENFEIFKTGIRTELAHEHYMEMSLFYSKLGLLEETCKILENAPVNPVIYYTLAYLMRDSFPGKSSRYLNEASRMSPEYVFPFREETIPVLKWAIRKDESDWKTKYYLGLIYWAKGRVDEAGEMFYLCSENTEPDFAPFYIIKGYLDNKNAVSFYKKAIETDENDWRNWHYLIRQYNNIHEYTEALKSADAAVKKFPDEGVIAMDYASSLFNNRQYRKCLNKLNNMEVLPYEGGWEAHNLFMRTQVYLAIENIKSGKFKDAVELLDNSKKYPERLGTGEPYEADFRLQECLKALCLDRMNKKKDAEKSRNWILDYTNRNWTAAGGQFYFALSALRDLGEREKYERLINDIKTRFKGNRNIMWHVFKFEGENEKAAEIEKMWINNPRYSFLVESAAIVEQLKR